LRAISLIELVLAVLILGLVAALAIPRLGRAAVAPDEGDLLRDRLKVLRIAIERYRQDHGVLPGQPAEGSDLGCTEQTVLAQLTGPTDRTGRPVDAAAAGPCFGPYLRDGIPPCPVPPREGKTGIATITGAGLPAYLETATEAGWIYNCQTGQIAANSDALDPTGRGYIAY